MMRSYCQRILRFVNPDGAVDEASLEAGFLQLDGNGDGRVTLEDLVNFLRRQRASENMNIPDGFYQYQQQSMKSN